MATIKCDSCEKVGFCLVPTCAGVLDGANHATTSNEAHQ